VSRFLGAVRSRLTLDRIAIAVVLVGLFLGIRSLTEGSSDKPQVDHAAALVPQKSLLYVHLRTDTGSSQFKNAGKLLRKLPTITRLRDQALREVAGGRNPNTLLTQVQPWLGHEAALALLPGRTAATSLILLQVADRAGAQAFLDGAGKARPEVYRGIPVRLYKTLAAAFIGDFVAIGRRENVHAAILARAGGSLGANGVFRAAVGRLELESPLLYAYAPSDGVRRLLQRQPGLVGRLGDLLARPGLRGVAISARFQRAGIRVAIASETVPLLPGAAGGEAARFRPVLPGALPGDAIAYFGVKGIARLYEQLSALAGGEGSPLARQVTQLRRSLGPSGEEGLRRAIRPLADRETALVVTPPAEAPIVTLVVGDTTAQQGGNLLVSLQPLLSKLLESPQQGQVPALLQREVAGVQTTTLQLMPGLELTYAAFGNRIVVSTSTDGIRQLRARGRSLAANARFAPGLDDFLEEPTSVVFLELHRLSALVERAGLGATPEYRAIRPDIAKIGTVNVITTTDRSSQTAQVFVEVP
jgi:Protein of unknown function (DUF3352)